MVKVVITYEYTSYYGEPRPKYLNVSITGHATAITGTTHLKVCSSITTILAGIENFIDNIVNDFTLQRGLFYFESKNSRYDITTQNAIDVAVCQIYWLYQHYPKYFSEYTLIRKGD